MDWRNGIDLTGLTARVEAAADDAARLIGEHILTESQKVVPIEEGTLARSGSVDTERQGDTSVAAISYSTPYAVRQHEELDYRHDEGRTAKYLEKPLSEAGDTARQIAAVQLGKALQ